jgi:hypothetical protein
MIGPVMFRFTSDEAVQADETFDARLDTGWSVDDRDDRTLIPFTARLERLVVTLGESNLPERPPGD